MGETGVEDVQTAVEKTYPEATGLIGGQGCNVAVGQLSGGWLQDPVVALIVFPEAGIGERISFAIQLEQPVYGAESRGLAGKPRPLSARGQGNLQDSLVERADSQGTVVYQ